MIHSEDPLLHVRCRHLRDEVELVVGRSAVRVILAIVTLAAAALLALSGAEHGGVLADVIRRLPPF
jgi:hypothetical protein